MALFNRVKSCSVDEMDNELYQASGTFIDTYHEINLTLHVKRNNLEIVWAKAEMVRIPDADCAEAQKQDRLLVGLKIGPGLRKALQNTVGNEQGCTHLADLALDLVKAVIVANNKAGEPFLSEQEIVDKYSTLYGGTCNHWTIMAKQKKAAAQASS